MDKIPNTTSAYQFNKTTACTTSTIADTSWWYMKRLSGQYWTPECIGEYNSTVTYPQANFFFFFSLLDSFFSCKCGNKCIAEITKRTLHMNLRCIQVFLKIVEIWIIIYLQLLTELFGIYSICYLFSKLQLKKIWF